MRRMKDSGIEWIGEIPESWEVRKVKHYYQLKTGFTPDTKHEEYYDDENGYDWVTISDIVDGSRITTTKKKISSLYVSEFNPEIIPEGSLMYSFKLSVGQTAFAGKNLYSNEAIASFYPATNADLHFLRYSSTLIVENAETNIYNAKILNRERINNAWIVFPPISEQHRIAAYLDTKCTHINSVLMKTRTSIEEYKKLKQSVITQAVTKGVRGDRPMKDSGIEWIGEIPEEWDLCRFERLLDERNEKNSPVKTDERLSLSIDKGITLYADKTTNLDRYKEDVSQYKLAHIGDFVMNSMNMIVGAVGVSDFYGCVSPVYYTFFDHEEDNCYCRFCDFLFHTPTLKQVLFSLGKGIMAIDRGDGRVNTCRLKVPRYDLKKMMLPVPPKSEMREIIDYLDAKCAGIDRLIAKKEQLITELERCRKSLIYEYVTGKKEVPVS